MSTRLRSARPVRVEFFGDEIESIRQFDVESQRSVLKVPNTTLLPLAEYPRSRSLLRELAAAARKADLDLSNPGEVFPGWEFLVPLVRPRHNTLLSLTRDAIVVLDEPSDITSAADRLWQRLDHPDKPAPIEPDRNFVRWEALQQGFGDRTTINLQQLELITRTSAAEAIHQLPHPHPPIPHLPRQHGRRRGRSTQPDPSRKSRGVLRRIHQAKLNAWPMSCKSTQSLISSASNRAPARAHPSPNAPTMPAPSPALT